MDAMGTGCQCHIHAIVHEHLRVGSSGRFNTTSHQCGEMATLEVPLPNLNQADACSRRGSDKLDEPILLGPAPICQAVPIRNQTDHDCLIVSIVCMVRRAHRTEASS